MFSMTTPLALLVLAAPLAFLATAVLARGHRGTRPEPVIRAGKLAAAFGLVVAAVAGVVVAVNGLVESPTVGIDGVGFSLRLDALSTVMLGMIALLAVVIYAYSCTYLDGDERHGAFLGRLAATVAAVELLVLAGNLGVLVVAWVLTSLALHQLLVFYRERPRAVAAARKKWIVARIGDAFLVTGSTLLVVHFGTGNLEQIFEGVRQAVDGSGLPGIVSVAAVCFVVAAILKSAQFPTHGWLVEVMETPTPVSALLHAGILNAGPFLAIRMAFVIGEAQPATLLLVAAGGITAVFASVVLLTQPSIKVVLGYSSAAHMGFMLLICGLGAFPAALLHLVAHSFYKAHAFLSSGSVIDDARAAKVALPRRLGSPVRIVGSAIVALALYLALALVWGVDLLGDTVVLAIGAILVVGITQLVAPALDSDGPVVGTIRASVLALGVTTSFFALEAGVHALLDRTVPKDTTWTLLHGVLAASVVLVFAVVVLLQILEPSRPASTRRRALAVHARNGLYANVMFDRLVGSFRTPAPPTAEVGR
jgi:NAD(P)H-quinone oxidoreductase subunit 5